MPINTFRPPQPDTGSAADTITAAAGGGTTNATLLTARFNHVTTVATSADSVKLPPWYAGATIFVSNEAAANAAVFPYETYTKIGNGSAGASATVNAGKVAQFIATKANTWVMVLSA